MSEFNDLWILYPVFALAALVFIVIGRMGYLRFAALKRREVDLKYYEAYRGDDEPEPVKVVGRHFVNLFEVPVLFYVASIMIYVTGQTSVWLVALGWLYVALRYLHSYIHLGSNKVMVRFRFYFLSCLVLMVMWLTLLVQLLLA